MMWKPIAIIGGSLFVGSAKLANLIFGEPVPEYERYKYGYSRAGRKQYQRDSDARWDKYHGDQTAMIRDRLKP